MIVRLEPDRTLVDREALAQLTGRSIRTIRRHCLPHSYRRGRALYDLDVAVKVLGAVPVRQRG